MKTRRYIFSGLLMTAAALLCCTGCKKEDEGEKIVLGVDFEQTAGMQKTYIGNGDRTIYWNVGDEVNINGSVCEVHDGAVEVTLNDSGYAAVYPATVTLTGRGKNCPGGSVEIPATQTYAADANGIQQLNAPMAGRLDSKSGRLLFRNLYAVIKVKVKAGGDAFVLNSITVESTNGKVLAGTQPFTFTTSQETGKTDGVSLTAVSSGSRSVTLTGIGSTIQAGDSASFYLYTVPFDGANLTVTLNGVQTDRQTRTRNGVVIGRSQLKSTDVASDQLQSIPVFSVSGTQKVTFSPGNLQWSATGGGTTPTTHVVAGGGTAAGTWRFAEHQYDRIGDAPGNASDKNTDRSTQSAWIDLFGWGTSGWTSGANEYQPFATTAGGANYQPGNNGNNNLTGTYANADWGVYNAIYNPQTGTTDAHGTWRTLTEDEWVYLLSTSTGASAINRYKESGKSWWIYNMVDIVDAVGTEDIRGLIIYPDGVTAQPDGLSVTLTQNSKTAKDITLSDFAVLEAAGCAFLPVTGYRLANAKPTTVDLETTYGYYWSSTHGGTATTSILYFLTGTVNPDVHHDRALGAAVRLVKEIPSGN